MKKNKLISAISFTCYLIVVVFILFLALDYLSRPFLNNYSTFEKLYPTVGNRRHPFPYIMFKGKPNAGHNRLGYRGKEPTIPKPKKEYRIIMIGGSTVYHGDPTICQLLEENFSKYGLKNVKVYNFGVVSSTSGLELARLVHEVYDLSPNLVVFYNGSNDILQPLALDPRPGYPSNFAIYESNPLFQRDIKKYPLFTLTAYGSNILRYLFPKYFEEKFINISNLRKKINYNSDEWRNSIAEIYVKNMMNASLVAKAYGSESMVFFQPMLTYKQLDSLTKKEMKQLSYKFGRLKKEVSVDVRSKILTLVKSRKNNRLHFYDLSLIYSKVSEEVYTDIIHTKQEYKKDIADAMSNKIVRFLRSKGKK